MDQHKNLAYSLIAIAPSPAVSGTTASVTTGQGTRFPTVPFNATIWAAGEIPTPTNAEIVRVTAMSGDAITAMDRAQEGTTARTIVVGDQIAAAITAKLFTDIEAAIPSTAGLISAVNVSAGATSNNLSALTFSNSNGVSFGLTGSVITATVATNYQSQGAYLTTAALSADSSKYAGTNGAITGGSITVNTSGVSVNLPAYLTTAMLSDAVTLSNIKVSAGASSTYLSALTFSNSNGLGFGLSDGTVTGSYTVPAAQTGISGIVASDATYTSGTVTFTGVGGGVTVKSNTGQRIDISVAAPVAQTVQTQNLVAVSLSGNTAGVLGLVSSGTVIFAGGNNITVSQNGQSVTISGPNVGGAQTGISGIVVSDTTYTSGTVSFSNAGNITIGSSVDGATQYIKLSGNAAQTNQSAIKAFGVSNTGQTAGNTGVSTGIDWVLAGSDSITLSQSTAGGGPNTVWFKHPAWITTATQSTQFMAMTLAGNTAGTTTFHATNNASLFFNGGNNITLSGNGSTVTIVGPNTSAQQTGISGLIVSDATYTSGTVSFSNAGNITISSSVNGATQYIKLSGNAAQTNQSAIKAFGVTNTGVTAGNTGVSTGIDWVLAGSDSITLSQSTVGGGPNTIWFKHPAWITVAGANINISAGATNNSGSAFSFADSNGVSFGLNASTITATVSTYDTVGTATTVKSVASANSVGTVTRWAAEDHAHAGIGGFGISTAGNTIGTTGTNLGTYWLQGGNSVTLSQITSNNGSHTIIISGPSSQTISYLQLGLDFLFNTVTSSFAQSTSYLVPFIVPAPLSVGSVRLFEVGTQAASSTQGLVNGSTLSMLGTTSHNFVFYTRGTGASSMSLQAVTSTQVVDKVSLNVQNPSGANSSQLSYTYRFTIGNTSFTKDYSSTAQSYNFHTSGVTDLTGTKMVDYPCGISLSAGQWFLGYGRSTTFDTQNAVISVATRLNISYDSQIAMTQATLGALGTLGGATNSSVMLATAGLGSFSTGGAAGTTASIGFTAISSGVSNQIPYMQLIRIV